MRKFTIIGIDFSILIVNFLSFFHAFLFLLECILYQEREAQEAHAKEEEAKVELARQQKVRRALINGRMSNIHMQVETYFLSDCVLIQHPYYLVGQDVVTLISNKHVFDSLPKEFSDKGILVRAQRDVLAWVDDKAWFARASVRSPWVEHTTNMFGNNDRTVGFYFWVFFTLNEK